MYEPTLKSRTVYHNDLRDYDDFTKNFLLDYKPKTVVEFPNLLGAGPINLISMGNGNPVLTDINTSDIGGLVLDATGEIYGFSFTLPYDMDPREACGFRVKWLKVQAAAAGTGAALWALTYNAAQAGVTALAIGATALTVPIANQADLAQYVPQWTQMGVIGAGALAALTPGDDGLDCSLAVTLDTITDATLLKVEFWYHPRLI